MARAETDGFRGHLCASIGRPVRPIPPGTAGFPNCTATARPPSQAAIRPKIVPQRTLATTLALQFGRDAAWNQHKQIFQHGNLIIDSTSLTAATERGAANDRTCAVAAAVFLF